MRSVVEKIVAQAGKNRPPLSSFDASKLVPAGSKWHADVKSYLEGCVPAETVELKPFHLLGVEELEEANSEYFPGHVTAPYGILTILTDEDGDALAVDIQDGKLYHLSQDRFELEGIIVEDEETGEGVKLELTRENILNSAEGFWPSLSVFFKDWLTHLESAKG